MLRAHGTSSSGSVLSQYECYSGKIGKVHKVLARHRQRTSRKLRLLYDKRRRFLRHALNSMVRKIVEELKEGGVRKVVVGYPKGVARNQGNKLTVNFGKPQTNIRPEGTLALQGRGRGSVSRLKMQKEKQDTWKFLSGLDI